MRKKGLAMLMAGIMIVSSCVMGCAKTIQMIFQQNISCSIGNRGSVRESRY